QVLFAHGPLGPSRLRDVFQRGPPAESAMGSTRCLARGQGLVRLLFLSMTLPWPPNNGHRMRTWSLLRALAAEGHQTTLLAFAYPADLGGATGPLRQVCTRLEGVPLELASLAG